MKTGAWGKKTGGWGSKRALWDADLSTSEESAEYREGMAVSNLLLWKRDPLQHVFVWQWQWYVWHREGSRGRPRILGLLSVIGACFRIFP